MILFLEIYKSQAVLVTVHCYLRLVNYYSKVKNLDKIQCVFILQLFSFQVKLDMEEKKTMFMKKTNKILQTVIRVISSLKHRVHH